MQVAVDCRCPMCGAISHILCDEVAWDAYEDGALAQEAFADMDLHTRETIISGMCLSCQDRFFIEDDEDCDGDCITCTDFDCPGNRNLFECKGPRQ